jgi:hypothetical protein
MDLELCAIANRLRPLYSSIIALIFYQLKITPGAVPVPTGHRPVGLPLPSGIHDAKYSTW